MNNVRFEIARPLVPQDASKRDAFLTLRHKVFAEKKGWEEVRNTRLEMDGWDDDADFYLIVENDEVIGGCRLITKQGERPLPVEEFLSKPLPLGSVEISRMIGTSRSRLHMRELYRFMLEETRVYRPGLREAYADIRSRYLQLLRKIGIDCFEPLMNKSLMQKGKDFFVPVRIPIHSAAACL